MQIVLMNMALDRSSICVAFFVEVSREETVVKKLFNLPAISWEAVIVLPLIFNWSGNIVKDLCASFWLP